MDDWRLTAIQALAQSAKSIAVPLKLFHGKLTAEEAFTAARVEEQHQIEACGFVYDGHDVDINFLRLRFFTCVRWLDGEFFFLAWVAGVCVLFCALAWGRLPGGFGRTTVACCAAPLLPG